jgi:hypothetical protein
MFGIKILLLILLPVLLLVYLTNRSEPEAAAEKQFITLAAYQQNEDNPTRSDPVQELLLDCRKEVQRCQLVKRILSEKQCPEATGNPQIMVVNKSSEVFLGADCPQYSQLAKVFPAANDSK